MAANHLVAQLREAARDSSSPDTRRLRDVQRTLQHHGDQVVPALAPLLDDPNPRVGEAAADVLQAIASDRAYDRLVAYALRRLDDPSGRTKLPGPGRTRLRTLGPAVLPALARAYGGEPEVQTRLAIIHLVQQIGDAAGWPVLEQALADGDPRLVEAAAEGLGQIGGPDAYDRLLRLLTSDDVQHRAGAIRGLSDLGNAAAVEPLLAVLVTEDQPPASWGPSPEAEPDTLHELAADAIYCLTGEQFDGEVDRIRGWLTRQKR